MLLYTHLNVITKTVSMVKQLALGPPADRNSLNSGGQAGVTCKT